MYLITSKISQKVQKTDHGIKKCVIMPKQVWKACHEVRQNVHQELRHNVTNTKVRHDIKKYVIYIKTYFLNLKITSQRQKVHHVIKNMS